MLALLLLVYGSWANLGATALSDIPAPCGGSTEDKVVECAGSIVTRGLDGSRPGTTKDCCIGCKQLRMH